MKRLVYFLMIISPVIFLASCSKQGNRASAIVQVAPDAFIQELTLSEEQDLKKFAATGDLNCYEHIARVTCISSTPTFGFDHNCDFAKVSSTLFAALNTLSSNLPPIQRKVFCGLSRIQIQQNIDSMAYAGLLTSIDKIGALGTMIGIREDIVLNRPELSNILTWKEQLNFGLSKPGDPTYQISPLGPKLVENIKVESPILFRAIVHEANHILDLLNTANIFESCTKNPDTGAFNCTIDDKSFSKISWDQSVLYKDNGEPKFPLLRFCYYRCENLIPLNAMEDTYSELRDTSFLSSYSTVNEREDFAEAGLFWTLKKYNIEFTHKVIGPDGKEYFDALVQLESGNLKEKNNWLDGFFSKTDLVYNVD
jgi:hypothetical protein